MNIEALRKTQESIRAEKVAFEMQVYMIVPGLYDGEVPVVNRIQDIPEELPCGTAACIAGHAVLVNETRQIGHFSEAAIDILGLSSVTCEALFMGHFSKNDLEDITSDEALAAIDYLIEHGEDEFLAMCGEIMASYQVPEDLQ